MWARTGARTLPVARNAIACRPQTAKAPNSPGSSGLGSELHVPEVMDEDDDQGADDRERSRPDPRPPAVRPSEVDARLPHGEDGSVESTTASAIP
jgi:hypothetical protein